MRQSMSPAELQMPGLLIAQSGPILRLTFDAPTRANGVDRALFDRLPAIFDAISRDESVAVVVLTGAGRVFSAGADAAWLRDSLVNLPDPARHAYAVKSIVHALLDCPKPLVCRLNGDAMGLGASLALLCDIVVAAEGARIGDPHVKLGVVPSDGGIFLWPALVGFARAKDVLLRGAFVTATEAMEIGLIRHAVPPDRLDATVDQIVAELAALPRLAVQRTKLVVNAGLRQAAAAALDASVAAAWGCIPGDEYRVGVGALLRRLEPDAQPTETARGSHTP